MSNSLSLKTKLLPFALMGAFFATTGCGNTWISAKEREESPSAMMLAAEAHYDKGEFAKAAELYNKVVAKDPNNPDARVNLAFSYNALAGLLPSSLISKLSKMKIDSSSSGASGGASSSANSTFSLFTELVGMSEAEKLDLAAKGFTTIKQFREYSEKFRIYHESWISLCTLVPADIIKGAVGDDVQTAATLEIDKCKGGLIDESMVPDAFYFGAAMQSLAQGAALFQTVVDKDEDGQIDLVQDANELSVKMTNLKTEIETITDPAILSEKMKEMNGYMSQMTKISDGLKGELLALTLTQFSLVGALSEKLFLPDEIRNNIASALAKFGEAKQKLQEFGSPKQGDKSQAKVTESAKKASETVDNLYQKQIEAAGGDPVKEAAAQEQLKESCTNFDALKSAYGLPADTQPPSSCNEVASLTGSSDSVATQSSASGFLPDIRVPHLTEEQKASADLAQGVIGMSIYGEYARRNRR